MFAGAGFESLAQVIADFLANRTAVNAVDLNIRGVRQSRHAVSNPSWFEITSIKPMRQRRMSFTQLNLHTPELIRLRELNHIRAFATGLVCGCDSNDRSGAAVAPRPQCSGMMMRMTGGCRPA